MACSALSQLILVCLPASLDLKYCVLSNISVHLSLLVGHLWRAGPTGVSEASYNLRQMGGAYCEVISAIAQLSQYLLSFLIISQFYSVISRI